MFWLGMLVCGHMFLLAFSAIHLFEAFWPLSVAHHGLGMDALVMLHSQTWTMLRFGHGCSASIVRCYMARDYGLGISMQGHMMFC